MEDNLEIQISSLLDQFVAEDTEQQAVAESERKNMIRFNESQCTTTEETNPFVVEIQSFQKAQEEDYKTLLTEEDLMILNLEYDEEIKRRQLPSSSAIARTEQQPYSKYNGYPHPANALQYSEKFKSEMKIGIMAKVADNIVGYLLNKPKIKNGERVEIQRKKSLSNIDGEVYDSSELDCVFKIVFEMQMNGVLESDLKPEWFPKRLQFGKDPAEQIRHWLMRMPKQYRIMKSTDPESCFSQMGRFGLRALNEQEKIKAEREQPMAEYELHIFRLSQWCEVPQRKFYERIFVEGHGVTHAGTHITESAIQQRFWCPNFKIYTADFIQNCTVCQLKFPTTRLKRRAASHMMYEENPLDRLQADLIKVPEILKNEGTLYQYILTIIDHHSKKAWAKVLKNKRAESVALILGKLFDKIYNRRGQYPRVLHTDNGGEFRNQIMEVLCKQKGIKQISGAPYHSQSQGLVERLNRTVQESLSFYKQDLAGQAFTNPSESCKYELKSALRAIMKVYNNRQHSTIKMTPNEAYLQQFISSRTIKNLDAENIRQYAVKHTTAKVDYFARLGTPVNVGDPVLVKSSLRIKIRLDGTRLLLPPKENHRHGKFSFKATVHSVVGNSFNLEWGQDSPELGLFKGQIIYNVPTVMFLIDLNQVQLMKLKENSENRTADVQDNDKYRAPYILEDKLCLLRI